jgi:threonine synthase
VQATSRGTLGAMVTGLRCVSCGTEFVLTTEPLLTCPACGEDRGTLDYCYDYEVLRETVKRPVTCGPNMTSWLPLLPIHEPASLPSLPVGPTLLVETPRLASFLGLKTVYLKLDSLLPSGSLKDRASAVALAQAKEMGYETIVAASTGNAASSLATLAASTGQKAVLFVPEDAPRAKLLQIAVHGGILVPLRTNYDHAFELSREVALSQGWYIRSTAINPILSEGKKTAALETACQLNWHVDQHWFVSVGDGCIYGSFYKGLAELGELGWISEIPPLVGVQAEGASPLAQVWQQGLETPVFCDKVDTYADSIAVGHPRDWVKALRAARESNGALVTVSDELIRDAARILATEAGVFAEPAAAASLAGVLAAKESGQIGKDDSAVIFVTGHGLKDLDALARQVSIPDPLEADPDTILDYLKREGHW